MGFIQACNSAIDSARESGVVHKVYSVGGENYVSVKDGTKAPTSMYLFMAYPGGRKVLSLRGVPIARKHGFTG